MTSSENGPESRQTALAIDIGSSSVRALLYDVHGTRIENSEVQLHYRQIVTEDGGSESNAAALLEATIRCVDGVLERMPAEHIATVGITSFWHGLLGLDRYHSLTTPVYMWSDKRSGSDAEQLGAEMPTSEAQARTGCRIHSSYWPAKLRWLERTQPERAAATATWVSVTDFICHSLTGLLSTSVSMASGTGLLSASTLAWDAAMLALIGISEDRLPSIVDRTDALPALSSNFANRWPALRGVPWFPAIGDGAAANVGSGCVGPSRIAFTIGTSAAMRLVLPSNQAPSSVSDRLWRYRLDRDMAVIGGALSNGGNAASWMADRLHNADLNSLTRQAENVEPDSHGLTMLPLFAGERSPSWDEHATGTITGLRHSTTPGAMFRATLESTAYRLSAIYDDLLPAAAEPHEIHANGAAALGSPLWLQIIADTLDHDIQAVDAEAEASARGAALCAFNSAGLLGTLAVASRPVATIYSPGHQRHAIYIAAKKRQSQLEEALNSISGTPEDTTP